MKQSKLWHTIWYLIGHKNNNKMEITVNWWHSVFAIHLFLLMRMKSFESNGITTHIFFFFFQNTFINAQIGYNLLFAICNDIFSKACRIYAQTRMYVSHYRVHRVHCILYNALSTDFSKNSMTKWKSFNSLTSHSEFL